MKFLGLSIYRKLTVGRVDQRNAVFFKQALLNLLIFGKATPNVFNMSREIKNENGKVCSFLPTLSTLTMQ